jgi:predicted DNA-binding transcriptional regulator AlpA
MSAAQARSRSEDRERRYLTTKQAAELLVISPATLDTWRSRGGGPTYIKASTRRILYDRRDLEAWLEARKLEKTKPRKTGSARRAS